jgi:Ca2+-binding EF-hand superfamily protein
MKERAEKRRAECKADPAKCEREKKARMEERFKRADADGNGLLSRAEAERASPRLAKRFSRFDVNGDGQLSLAELSAARPSGTRGHHHPAAKTPV